MAVDIKQARSRRALLAGMAGAAGAFAASAMGRPLSTRAGVDGDVSRERPELIVEALDRWRSRVAAPG